MCVCVCVCVRAHAGAGTHKCMCASCGGRKQILGVFSLTIYLIFFDSLTLLDWPMRTRHLLLSFDISERVIDKHHEDVWDLNSGLDGVASMLLTEPSSYSQLWGSSGLCFRGSHDGKVCFLLLFQGS